MTSRNSPLLPVPPDARRAAARARDAVRAALARANAGTSGPEVDLTEPETAFPVAGLARALREAAERPGAHLFPGGGWAGAPFPAEETYVASWELDLLAERRAAGPARTVRGAAGAPAAVRGRAAGGEAEAFSPWIVHSFSGRKGHARPDVLALVPAWARSVLDVGCGEGALGASLQARGARVTGIELDKRAAVVAASRLARVLDLPAEEALGALDARPDVVVLADVLEHLDEPAAVLGALRAALAPGGLLVFSVPNATHASVLGGVLRGRWDRELEGIVADDHRTYAGRAGWRALLAGCGFRVTSLGAAAARTSFSEGDRKALLAATRLEPDDLDAVQWVGTAEPASPAAGVDWRVVPPATGDPLEAEDPVAEAAARVATGRLALPARNAARAGLVEALVSGGVVAGADALALLCGWTPSGLARRFEGSGLAVRVDPSGVEPISPVIRAVLEARRAAGLPFDEAALSAAGWVAGFSPGVA